MRSNGSTCSAMAGQYDIFPTILSLAGCKYELEPLQPGKSLLEQINHPTETVPASFMTCQRTRMRKPTSSEIRNSDKTYFIAFINCYILSSKSLQTLENAKFIACEFALRLSLVLYPFPSCYELS